VTASSRERLRLEPGRTPGGGGSGTAAALGCTRLGRSGLPGWCTGAAFRGRALAGGLWWCGAACGRLLVVRLRLEALALLRAQRSKRHRLMAYRGQQGQQRSPGRIPGHWDLTATSCNRQPCCGGPAPSVAAAGSVPPGEALLALGLANGCRAQHQRRRGWASCWPSRKPSRLVIPAASVISAGWPLPGASPEPDQAQPVQATPPCFLANRPKPAHQASPVFPGPPCASAAKETSPLGACALNVTLLVLLMHHRIQWRRNASFLNRPPRRHQASLAPCGGGGPVLRRRSRPARPWPAQPGARHTD